MFPCRDLLYRSCPSLHLQADRPDVPGVPDLAMVKCRDSHKSAASERNVIFTSGIEAARDLECPMSGSPTGGAPDIGAITGEITGDDHARNNDAHGQAAIEFGTVRQ